LSIETEIKLKKEENGKHKAEFLLILGKIETSEISNYSMKR